MGGFDDPTFRDQGIRGEGDVHPEDVRNPEVTYDRTDMSPRAIVGFLIFLAIAGVIMHLVLWGIYKQFAGSYKAKVPTANPIASSNRQFNRMQGNPELTFPEPRLQADDVGDMNKFRIQEEQILRTYDWVNQNAGVVRIPIAQAIDMVAGQGLPTRQQQPQQTGEIESELEPAAGSDGAFTVQRANQPKFAEQAPPAPPSEQ